jgi:hypothetical protein
MTFDDSANSSSQEMWENLTTVATGRVELERRKGKAVIVWQKESGEEQLCMFTAASLMMIFDSETHENYVD